MDQDELIRTGKYLPLIEEFYTIQGEGFHAGKAAYFVRLGGCDIGCEWCDTKFSWNASAFPPVAIDEIISKITNLPAKAVVVSGGEPLMYNLAYFTGKLKDHQIETFIETSGCHAMSGYWDWICLSPKKQNPPIKENLGLAHELKVIIRDKKDIEWAETNAEKVGENCYLYLQPEWSSVRRILPFIIEYVKQNPKWQISLQVHKYMGIP